MDLVVMETSPSTVLELGTYCGYSTVRIARLLLPATKLITVEMNPEHAHVARQVIQYAGLQDKVRCQGHNIKQGQGSEVRIKRKLILFFWYLYLFTKLSSSHHVHAAEPERG
ncbi:hypothetical protein AN641_04240 [Candidatus Epulonipiscioides gigas]|nr:hypothetical protein AN641_04240 [Epulopiscium sp. SCG-C07WGA-EpuloA2]